ncbi:MAG: preprotein translocase, SecG subunit [uncultured bacterium]|nr:MAG: preprotein translocase, SecG subunit [uncultured bacterium]
MQEIIFVIHILAAICLVFLVLIQHGKGADMGAAFGSGASNTVFGSIGSVPFLIKVTALIAAVFFATSIMLGVMISKQVKQGKISAGIPMVPFEQGQ